MARWYQGSTTIRARTFFEISGSPRCGTSRSPRTRGRMDDRGLGSDPSVGSKTSILRLPTVFGVIGPDLVGEVPDDLAAPDQEHVVVEREGVDDPIEGGPHVFVASAVAPVIPRRRATGGAMAPGDTGVDAMAPRGSQTPLHDPGEVGRSRPHSYGDTLGWPAASPPTRSTSRSRNWATSALVATSRLGGLPVR